MRLLGGVGVCSLQTSELGNTVEETICIFPFETGQSKSRQFFGIFPFEAGQGKSRQFCRITRIVDTTMVRSFEGKPNVVEGCSHTEAPHAIDTGKLFFDIDMRFKRFRERNTVTTAIGSELARVVRTPRTQHKGFRANPVEERLEHGRKCIGRVDIGLRNRRKACTKITQPWFRDGTDKPSKFIDDLTGGRRKEHSANLDNFHAAGIACILPAGCFEINDYIMHI